MCLGSDQGLQELHLLELSVWLCRGRGADRGLRALTAGGREAHACSGSTSCLWLCPPVPKVCLQRPARRLSARTDTERMKMRDCAGASPRTLLIPHGTEPELCKG